MLVDPIAQLIWFDPIDHMRSIVIDYRHVHVINQVHVIEYMYMYFRIRR